MSGKEEEDGEKAVTDRLTSPMKLWIDDVLVYDPEAELDEEQQRKLWAEKAGHTS